MLGVGSSEAGMSDWTSSDRAAGIEGRSSRAGTAGGGISHCGINEEVSHDAEALQTFSRVTSCVSTLDCKSN